MHDPEQIYRSKLTTNQDLVASLAPGTRLLLGTWAGQPHGFIRALNERADGPDPLYVTSHIAVEASTYLDRPSTYCTTGFFGASERAARDGSGNVLYVPVQFTAAGPFVEALPAPDYFVIRVAAMDDRGRFNASLNAGWEYRAALWLRRNRPQTRIVFEVCPHLPSVRGLAEHGDNELPLDLVDHIVEDATPPFHLPTPQPDDTARGIATHVAALIDDRATLQLGFGNVPMMVGSFLRDRRELGIHTELLCDAHVDLIAAGSVTNAHKGLYDGKSVAAFAAGTAKLWSWVADNPDFAMLPVEEVNSAAVLARVRNLVSINSALTVDLAGQTCAHCLGARTYSGLGGAFEFTYGAQLSPGGKSIVCLPSTTRLRDGRVVSNVVARHPAGTRITVPEHCIDWVVTEHGATRLKFLATEERARALIGIAHPDFREQLAREATETMDPRVCDGYPSPPRAFFVTGATT
jgi:4-hydroxybutyrate CoA-transferase